MSLPIGRQPFTVSAGTLTAESVKDLTAVGAEWTAAKGDIEAVSYAGSVDLTDALLTTLNEGDLIVKAAVNMKLKDAELAVDGGLFVTADSGDLDLSGSSGESFDELDLRAGRDVILGDLETTVDNYFNVEAGEDVLAEGLKLTVGTNEAGEAADVTITAETGSIELDDADFVGTEENDGRLGNVVLSAGADLSAKELFRSDKDFTASSLSLKAGDTVDLGMNAQSITTTEGELHLSGTTLVGNGFAADTSLTAKEDDLTVAFEGDLLMGEGFSAYGVNTTFASNNFSLSDRTEIRGSTSATIDATGAVDMTGDVLVTADESVAVTAEVSS